ncbi:MAG: YgiQ family radical SAM protein, partial [Desulfobacteraceae bacterium]|nr:YgiQ family radical SAM protein [Desulfobacteraceae bacterium]
DFRQFGPPRLFFGITAGNLDSIVANYSGNAKVRDRDDYSPGGNPYFGDRRDKSERRRPDRAVIVYANLARAAFPAVPVVLGGLEASLRRFVHYDYQQAKLRGSSLADAKADLLVYGMGERAVLAAAERLAAGLDLRGIPGTCERLIDKERAERPFSVPPVVLPSWQDILADRTAFLLAEEEIDRRARSLAPEPLLQRQQSQWVLQHPPAPPLAAAELDRLHGLPFARAPHPRAGDVPAYRMIRHSVTIVRGCCGNCSFCAIARHQGPTVVSRSPDSVVAEIERLTRCPDFHGTVSDLGGPTANLYGTRCVKGGCRKRDCLFPRPCPHLQVDEQVFLDLLARAGAVPGIKHLFVSSGLRMELLLTTPRLLAALLARHTPGALKIAPEHTETEVLRLMHKPGPEVLAEFLRLCREISRGQGREVHFTPYFISAHPGCRPAHMEKLAGRVRELGLAARQLQDFTPTPGTLATAMYVSGLARETHQPLYVARGAGERRQQRLALEPGRGHSDRSRRPKS